MATSLDRQFDIFTGALPEKEVVSDKFRTDAESHFNRPSIGKREREWLRMLERLHEQHATQASI